jgi:uncharacterized protein (TIGR02597 family)
MIRILQYAGLQSFPPSGGKAFEPTVPGALYVKVRVRKKMSKGPKKVFDSLYLLSNIASSMNILRPSIYAIALTSLALSGANAQTTATTDPVGFTTVNVRGKTGAAKAFTTVVLPMERPDAFVGACTGAIFTLDGARTVITFPSNIFSANQFTGTGNQHYFRLSNGANAGEFSTIVANTANSITLADDLNAVITDSSTFAVTPYWTLGTALPAGGGLQGGTSAAAADTVTIYNANFVGTVYFYNSTANQWRTGITASDNVIVPPGSGLGIERKQASAVSLVFAGSVPLGTSAVDVNGSLSGTATRNTLVGSAYPLASTRLADIGLYTGSSATGLQGGTSAAASDTLTIFNPANGVATVYFYNTTANQWRTGITDASNVTIPEGAAVLIARKNGRAPFTWYIPQPTMALN